MRKKADEKLVQAFGDLIHSRRTANNWSLRELANKCGFDTMTIYRVEKGYVEVGFTTMVRILNEVGLDIKIIEK